MLETHKYGPSESLSKNNFEQNRNWNGIVKPANASAKARLSKNIRVVLSGNFVAD